MFKSGFKYAPVVCSLRYAEAVFVECWIFWKALQLQEACKSARPVLKLLGPLTGWKLPQTLIFEVRGYSLTAKMFFQQSGGNGKMC